MMSERFPFNPLMRICLEALFGRRSAGRGRVLAEQTLGFEIGPEGVGDRGLEDLEIAAGLVGALGAGDDRDDRRMVEWELQRGGDQGRAAYVRELEKEISRHNLENIIQLAGDCRDMPAAFMLADVVVSTSVEAEAFGRVIVEAQAMGRPVIATDHGAARETVAQKETGWLVPPGDASALAVALREALSLDAATRDALAQRVVENVRADYTKELMCERTLAVYQELLTEKQGGNA